MQSRRRPGRESNRIASDSPPGDLLMQSRGPSAVAAPPGRDMIARQGGRGNPVIHRIRRGRDCPIHRFGASCGQPVDDPRGFQARRAGTDTTTVPATRSWSPRRSGSTTVENEEDQEPGTRSAREDVDVEAPLAASAPSAIGPTARWPSAARRPRPAGIGSNGVAGLRVPAGSGPGGRAAPRGAPAAPRAGEVQPVDGERHGELQGDPERLDRDTTSAVPSGVVSTSGPEQRVEDRADKEVNHATMSESTM